MKNHQPQVKHLLSLTLSHTHTHIYNIRTSANYYSHRNFDGNFRRPNQNHLNKQNPTEIDFSLGVYAQTGAKLASTFQYIV